MPSAAIGGRYIVEDALGRGGMAAVYRVRDGRSGARLALKRSWANDPAKARKRSALLEREFHTLAQLRHPRIIEVYDFGIDDYGPYYTMELLDGADLENAGRLPWPEACSLLRDIASSLAVLHSRGLIHRDVSSRNVRRTADGHAKLIDFGTMASIGVASDVVGTPQFMAPEVLQMQALDARADLFSLGALGYYLLTGRHAYPASRPSELRDVWRTRPAPPARLYPELPAALSTLILQLIALDRSARPESAAEVMERLGSIAGLPNEELPAITRAYLTTPTLVGRDKALTTVRARMLSLVRGDGGALLIEGSAGSGRSRMIDACVFEGKLLGASVARVNLAHVGHAPWSVARALCSELFALMPDAARDAARLARGVLEHIVEELRRDGSVTMSVTFPERSLLLRELRDFILALGSQHRLLLVVDDADRIDEASAALLAALADKTERQSLMLVLAMEPETQADRAGPLYLLRSLSHRIELEPLDGDQTEALMRSVFGDVPNLQLCASMIHAHAQGNPRTIMELAQHLSDRGLARYQSGRWTLPSGFTEHDLPKTLAESLGRRLAQLSPDALELAEILAIADGQPLTLASYGMLTKHRDSKRMFRALEELVSMRMVQSGMEYPRLTQRGFVPVLLGQLADGRRRTLHARLADLLAAQGGDVVTRAMHLLQGGRERQGLELMCSLDLQARPPPLRLLERAVGLAEELPGALPARAVHRLRMALLSEASLQLAAESFERWLPPVLQQLERDSGLVAYRELEGLPPEQRLTQALARQQERYLATPERDQVYAVGDAVRDLARLIGATCSMAGSTLDTKLLDVLPSLEPLLPLTPALRVVALLTDATREMILGRSAQAAALYEQALARIELPDRAGLDGPQLERTRSGVQYALALIEAHAGLPRTEERLKYLESQRAMRVAAWRVRSLLQLQQGNAEAAARSARRAEVLQLQDESVSHYGGTDSVLRLVAYSQSGDVLGMKSAVEAIDALAERFSGWRRFLPFAHSCFQALQGNFARALELIEPAMEQLQPGANSAYALSAVQHVRVLRELGATPETQALTRRYLELFREHGFSGSERFLHLEASLVFAKAGAFDEAVAILDDRIGALEARGAVGLALGMFYEARARVAIWMGDRAGFEQFVGLCAREYAKGHNPALQHRYARLIEEARQQNVALLLGEMRPEMASIEPELPDSEYDALHSRMLECVDAADRARCALTMLLQSTDSYLGYLYGVREGEVFVLAGLPETFTDAGLETWLSSWVREELERTARAMATTTVTSSDQPPAAESETSTFSVELDGGNALGILPVFTDVEGRRFFASALVAGGESQRVLVAVLAVQVEGHRMPTPPGGLRAQIAGLLLQHGDAAGVPL